MLTSRKPSSLDWYAASDHVQQSLKNAATIITDARVHILVGDPLPDALDEACCPLRQLKINIQVLHRACVYARCSRETSQIMV